LFELTFDLKAAWKTKARTTVQKWKTKQGEESVKIGVNVYTKEAFIA